MIERGKDRRQQRAWFSNLSHDRRRGVDRRACATPLTWSAPVPGTIRPGVGEAAPVRERRRVPEAGME
jgi:hypothetical protein